MLSSAEVRAAYGPRELVDLHRSRWVFLNTLFSVSEAVMFAQLVDRLDQGAVAPHVCPNSYPRLHDLVSKALFLAQVEGKLMAEIVRDPGRCVEPDPELPQVSGGGGGGASQAGFCCAQHGAGCPGTGPML